MYLLSLLLTMVLSWWILANTDRRLSRKEFGGAWKVSFRLLFLGGLALGILFINVNYLASSTSKVYGIPFAIAGADFIRDRWLAGGVGRFMPLPVLADLAAGVALCLLPLNVASRLRGRRMVSSAILPG